MPKDKRAEYTVMLHKDGDELVVIEHGPQGHRRELNRLEGDAKHTAGLVMLDWHTKRLLEKERALYDWVLECKPTIDPYQAIGIIGYIQAGVSKQTVAKMAGISEGQMELG